MSCLFPAPGESQRLPAGPLTGLPSLQLLAGHEKKPYSTNDKSEQSGGLRGPGHTVHTRGFALVLCSRQGSADQRTAKLFG